MGLTYTLGPSLDKEWLWIYKIQLWWSLYILLLYNDQTRKSRTQSHDRKVLFSILCRFGSHNIHVQRIEEQVQKNRRATSEWGPGHVIELCGLLIIEWSIDSCIGQRWLTHHWAVVHPFSCIVHRIIAYYLSDFVLLYYIDILPSIGQEVINERDLHWIFSFTWLDWRLAHDARCCCAVILRMPVDDLTTTRSGVGNVYQRLVHRSWKVLTHFWSYACGVAIFPIHSECYYGYRTTQHERWSHFCRIIILVRWEIQETLWQRLSVLRSSGAPSDEMLDAAWHASWWSIRLRST